MNQISQMLMDISQGYIDEDLSLVEKEHLMRSVGSAWNMACFDPPERFNQLHQYMQNFKMNNNLTADDYTSMEHKLMTLMEQKDMLYPNEKIKVLDVQLAVKNGQITLSVSSTKF